MSSSCSIFPPSQAQLDANYRNAKRSTGPRTKAGKTRASLNAITHGVFAKTMVVDGEQEQEFEALRIGLLRRLNPRDTLELALAEQIISANWRLHRLRQAENKLYQKVQYRAARPEQEQREKRVEDLEKDVEEAQKSVNRARTNRDWCVARHQELQQELEQASAELNEPIDPLYAGVVLYKLMGASSSSAGSLSAAGGTAPLERLHRYERGLENTIHRCLNQLKKLQEKPSAESLSELTGELIGDVNEPSNESRCDTDFQSVPERNEDRESKPLQVQTPLARTESPCHKMDDPQFAETKPIPSEDAVGTALRSSDASAQNLRHGGLTPDRDPPE